MTPTLRLLSSTLAAACLAALAPAAFAQATIDQNKALAGNVTPGDAAGFPVTLSVPGHYVLKSNLVVPSGARGIWITAEGVTLDLNGFAVRSSNVCSHESASKSVSCSEGAGDGAGMTGIGVATQAEPSGVVVRNGTVQGFRGNGLTVNGGTRVLDLIVRDSGQNGIECYTAPGIDAMNVIVTENRLVGLIAMGGKVDGVMAARNGSDGIAGGIGSLIHNSQVRDNGGIGIYRGHVRGTVSGGNAGGDTSQVISLGGNAKGSTVY